MVSKRKAWAMMAVVFLASIAVAANRFKVPPVMPVLMAEMDVGMATGGWLMSSVVVASLVLTIPGAFLLKRLGLRTTGLIAMGCCIAGAVIGALARGPAVLLVGRSVEGISFALIAVLAPAAITAWFGPRERGLPMGIWAAWVPVGIVIAFNVTPPLHAQFGWRSAWWLGAGLALVALIVHGLVVHDPPGAAPEVDGATGSAGETRSTGRVLLNPSTWLLGLAFGAFGFSTLAYNTWAPTYLTETLHVSAASASFYASLMFLAAIPANVAAGVVINRTKNRYLVLSLLFLITAVLFAWSFHLGSVLVAVFYMLLLGFVSNLIPASMFTLAPDTVPELRHAGLALALVITGSQIGSLTGPPVLGSMVNGGEWATGSTVLVAVMAAGVVFVLAGWKIAAAEGMKTDS